MGNCMTIWEEIPIRLQGEIRSLSIPDPAMVLQDYFYSKVRVDSWSVLDAIDEELRRL